MSRLTEMNKYNAEKSIPVKYAPITETIKLMIAFIKIPLSDCWIL